SAASPTRQLARFQRRWQVLAWAPDAKPSLSTRMSRNLLMRPARPAAGRGSVQQGIKRAFVMLGCGELSTSDIVQFTHALRLHQGRKLNGGVYQLVHRRLSEIADKVGRASTIGRPYRWRLKDENRPR